MHTKKSADGRVSLVDIKLNDHARIDVSIKPKDVALQVGVVRTKQEGDRYVETLDGVRVSLFRNHNPESDLNGVEFGLFGNVSRHVRGLQLSSGGNKAEVVDGGQVAFVMNRATTSLDGLDLAVLGNVVDGDVKGVLIGGCNFVGGDVDGVDLAVAANLVEGDVEGIGVAGLVNGTVGDAKGVRIAGLIDHVGGEAKGVDLAGIASTVGGSMTGVNVGGAASVVYGKAVGAQFAGLTNVAESGNEGTQLGLIDNSGKSWGILGGFRSKNVKLGIYTTPKDAARPPS